MLKDVKHLWGVDIAYLCQYSKAYRRRASVLYLIDLLFIGVLIFFMYCNHIGFGSYTVIMLAFSLVFFGFFSVLLDLNTWQAYKFYRRHKNREVRHFDVLLTDSTAENVLFCLKSHKNVKCKTISDYVTTMLGLCLSDNYNARQLYFLLEKYSGFQTSSVRVYYINTGRMAYVTDLQVLGNEVVQNEEETTTDSVTDVVDDSVSTEPISECVDSE